MFVLIPSTFLVVTRGVVWELEGMMVTWPYLFLDPFLWMFFLGGAEAPCSFLIIFLGTYCALLTLTVLYEYSRQTSLKHVIFEIWNILKRLFL
jgi:hypothetical protein